MSLIWLLLNYIFVCKWFGFKTKRSKILLKRIENIVFIKDMRVYSFWTQIYYLWFLHNNFDLLKRNQKNLTSDFFVAEYFINRSGRGRLEKPDPASCYFSNM